RARLRRARPALGCLGPVAAGGADRDRAREPRPGGLRRPARRLARARLTDPEAPLDGRMRVRPVPVAALREPDLPRLRAGERDARLDVHALAAEVEVLDLRAVANGQHVGAGLELLRARARRRPEGDART